jgi:prephenate dehydratase/prephenate dehydrogenase
VKHCLLAKPGVKRGDIKYAISHPQALAQCDNYLRGLGIKPIPTYDTAGSAKMIRDRKGLPDGCTPENTAAIASDLAGRTYGLDCLEKGIEDDDTNFTRFLLLGRSGVAQFLNKNIPSKTSIVFTLPNTAGALYKALACFSLREIDFSKIESRPTSASLLSFLKFRSQALGKRSRTRHEIPRFRYCFYLDFLESELDERAQYALSHLREQADFCRILGSYPAKSRLVGPVKDAVDSLKHVQMKREDTLETTLPSDEEETQKLNIGIVGYGAFGQFLGKQMAGTHKVRCIDQMDRSKEADRTNVEYYPMFDLHNFLESLDVVVFAVPLIEFEDVIKNIAANQLSGKLVVEVCPLSAHPKKVLLNHLGGDVDILSTHPMFGPSDRSGTIEDDAHLKYSWDGQPMVYDMVRVSDVRRVDNFLSIFERARCQMVAMSAEEHDKLTADAEFVTHLTGRILDRHMLPATPVSSREYAALCDVAEMTSGDTLDMFYGLYKYNPNAKEAMAKMRENLARIERQLAGKEAYLTAKAELQNSERQKLLADTRRLLEQIALDDAAVSVRRPRGAGSARTTSRSPSLPSNRVSRPSRSAATPSKREPLATKKPVTGSRPASRANGASPSTGAAKGQQ